jgi:hypothetical protein
VIHITPAKRLRGQFMRDAIRKASEAEADDWSTAEEYKARSL